MGFCNANGAVAQRIGNVENAAVAHCKQDITVLAVVFAVVKPLCGEGIVERFLGGVEAHAMMNLVPAGLGLIPFKVAVHNTTDYPYYVKESVWSGQAVGRVSTKDDVCCTKRNDA